MSIVLTGGRGPSITWRELYGRKLYERPHFSAYQEEVAQPLPGTTRRPAQINNTGVRHPYPKCYQFISEINPEEGWKPRPRLLAGFLTSRNVDLGLGRSRCGPRTREEPQRTRAIRTALLGHSLGGPRSKCESVVGGHQAADVPHSGRGPR